MKLHRTLPHPNPDLIKGRELDIVSPLYKGGLRGIIRFVYTPRDSLLFVFILNWY
jgi:hypothetical protein